MKNTKTKLLVRIALLFATAVVLSLLEMLFPLPIYGVRLGLSNIVIMYALLAINGKTAFTVGVLKSMFVLLTRGLVASLLSLCGFFAAFLIMMLMVKFLKEKVGYLLISVMGALAHNAGQLIAVAFLYSPVIAYANIPILGVSAVLTGCLTAILLKAMLPILKKM